MTSKKDTEAIRRFRVRQLYEARPFEYHTENSVLKFYGWLQRHHTELLPKPEQGDSYQHLMADLTGLYK